MVTAVWAAVAFVGSLAAAATGARVALDPLRKAGPMTWPERARLGYPGRAVTRLAVLLLPVVFAVAAVGQARGLSAGHPARIALPVALAALAGTFVPRLRVERELRGPHVQAGRFLRGWVASVVGLFPHLVIAGVAQAFTSNRFDARSLAVLAAAAVAVVATFAGAGVVVGLALRVVRLASGRLRLAVDAASAATGIRPRAVLELDLASANAFALPGARLLLFTPDVQRVLGDTELAAIARHELGHVSEPWRVLAARVSAALVPVAVLVGARPLLGELVSGEHLFRLVLVLWALVGAMLFVLLGLRPRLSRMEERADSIARAHDAHDGEYARALEALYAENLMPAVASARGMHPHLYDRLVASGVTPPWPRPAPPSGARLRAALASCMAVAAVAVAAALLLACAR